MTPVVWMVAGAAATSAAAAALAPREAVAILLGMIGPLAAVSGTWIALDYALQRGPAQVTSVLIRGMAVKAAFFLLYVAAVLRLLEVGAVPFVVSFTAYFIGLYFVEALLLSRRSMTVLRQAR